MAEQMADVLSVEKRQEANTALLEVDKGLHSSAPGEQCEAIVKFPSLMDRFPFPILINTAFLKLAEVFRTGSNLLRYHILKVVQLTNKHLNKITSTEEFIKRIFSVIHSNDPVARAITLRLFAATSSLVCDKKTIHHSIQNSLDSNDQIEVIAAVFAMDSLCDLSSVFAEGLYLKMADMVLGLKTPPEIKLRAIPVFRKMHHSLGTALKVREICLQLLEFYPTLTFVSVVLPTMTALAIATIVQVPDQVELLLKYVEKDVRKSVHHFSLLGLHTLSVKTPQCWKKPFIEKLLHLIKRSKVITETEVGCCILYNLSLSVSLQHLVPLEESIKPFCYGIPSPVTRAYATSCYCNILKFCLASSEEPTSMEIEANQQEIEGAELQLKAKNMMLLAMEILVMENFEGKSLKSIKALLGGIGGIADKVSVPEELLVSLLSQLQKLPSDCYPLLCTTVSLIAAGDRKWFEGERMGGEIVTKHLLKTLQVEDSSLLVPIGQMLLELHEGVYSSGQYAVFTSKVESVLLKCIWESKATEKYWVAYKLARRATQRGFHKMSAEIYNLLQPKVAHFPRKAWLETLELFSDAQCYILKAEGDPSKMVMALQNASSNLYTCALLIMNALPPNSLPSQLLPAYGGLLNLYSFLLSTCLRHRTIYSPYSDRGDAPIPKFKKFAENIRQTSNEFATLLKSLFDADPFTLQYIKLLQQSCNLMSNIIEAFTSPEKPLLSPVGSTSSGPSLPTSLETNDTFDTNHTLGIVCNKLLSDSQSTAQKLQSQPFSYEHLAVIEESILILLDVPFLLPPLYFASHQSTSVQLALSPPVSSDKPVTVVLGTHLALKVEGVVKHCGERIYRSPASVVVNVKPKVEKLADSSSKFPTLYDLEETPVVKNDYYVAEFLLTLPAAGQYVLMIDNSLVDHEGKIWHTGPSVEMNVVVDVEEKLKDTRAANTSTSASGAGSSGNGGGTPTSNGESKTTQKSSLQW